MSALLITDVEDTVLGDGAALSRFRAFVEADPGRLAVAYSSGRTVDSVLASVAEHKMPAPRAVVGQVGTQMRLLPENDPVPGWTARIGVHFRRSDVMAALANEPDLRLQAESDQGPLKISYHLEGASAARIERLSALVSPLGAQLVYSSALDLDVLPAGADKGTAARFLAETLGYSPDRVLVAGNSGNDLALFQQGFRGVVVGNAHEDLKAGAGPRAFVATARFADGVLEGLEHWLGCG